MSVYSDWEADLTSIIEKTNQNLMLLSRFGDKKPERKDDHSYDISTTRPYEPKSRQTLKKAIQERCNQDIAAHRVMPHDNNNAAGKNSRRSSKDMEMIRDPTPLSVASNKRYMKEANSSMEKRSAGAITLSPSTLDEMKNSLQAGLDARLSSFGNKIEIMRQDFTKLSDANLQLEIRIADMKVKVESTSHSSSSLMLSKQDQTEQLSRLDKNYNNLNRWKSEVDEDLCGLTNQVKKSQLIPDKIDQLEKMLDSVMLNVTDLSQRIKSCQKDKDQRFELMERDVTRLLDTKAVENIFQSRLIEPMTDLENRLQQRIEYSAQVMQQKFGHSIEQGHSQRLEMLQGWKIEAANRFEEIESKVRRYQKDSTFFAQSLENYTSLEASVLRCQSRLEQQEMRMKEMNENLVSKLSENLSEIKAELVQMLSCKMHNLSIRFEKELVTITRNEKQNKVFREEVITKMKSWEKKIKHFEKAANGSRQTAYSSKRLSAQQEVESNQLKQQLMRIDLQLEATKDAKEILHARLIAREKAYKVKLSEFEKKFETASVLATKEREELIEKIKQEARISGHAKGEQRVYKEMMDNVARSRDSTRAKEKKTRQELQHLSALLRKSEHDNITERANLRLSVKTKQNEASLLQHQCDISKKHVLTINKLAKKQKKKLQKQKMLLDKELHFLNSKLSLQSLHSKVATYIGSPIDHAAKNPAERYNGQEHSQCEQALQDLIVRHQQELQNLQNQYEELNDVYLQTKKDHEQEVTKTNALIYQEYAVALEELRNVLSLKEKEMMKQVDELMLKDEERNSQMEQLTSTLAMIREENDTLVHKLKSPILDKIDLEKDSHMLSGAEMKKVTEAKADDLDSAQNSLKELSSDLVACREAYNLQSERYKREISSLEFCLKETQYKMGDLFNHDKELLLDKERLERELSERNSRMERIGLSGEEDQQHLAEEFSRKISTASKKLIQVETKLAESNREIVLLRDTHQEVCDHIQEQAEIMSKYQTHMDQEIEMLHTTMQLEQHNSRQRVESLEEIILNLQNEISKLRVENEQATSELESKEYKSFTQQQCPNEEIDILRHSDDTEVLRVFEEKRLARDKVWSEMHIMALNEMTSWNALAKCEKDSLLTKLSEVQSDLEKSRAREMDLQKFIIGVMKTLTSHNSDMAWNPLELSPSHSASPIDSFKEHWTELKNRFQVKNAEIDALKFQTRILQNEQVESQSIIKALEEERNNVRDLLIEMRLKAQELENEMHALQTESVEKDVRLGCLEEEKLSLQMKIDELLDQAAILDTQIVSKEGNQKEEVEQAKYQYEELKRAHDKLEKTVTIAKEYLNRVENEKMIELDKLRIRVDVLEDEICATDTSDCIIQEDWNWQQIKSLYDQVDQRKSLIRTAFSKLSLSIGVTAWCQLRSLLHEQVEQELTFEKERKMDSRQLDVLQEEEDNILQSVETVSLILKHLDRKQNRSSEVRNNGSQWLRSFSDTAPLLVGRLKNMESACEKLFFDKRRNEAKSPCHVLTNIITRDDSESGMDQEKLSPTTHIEDNTSEMEIHSEECYLAVNSNRSSSNDLLLQTDETDDKTSKKVTLSDDQDENIEYLEESHEDYDAETGERDDARSWSPSRASVESFELIVDISCMSEENCENGDAVERNLPEACTYSVSQYDQNDEANHEDLIFDEEIDVQGLHSCTESLNDGTLTASAVNGDEHGHDGNISMSDHCESSDGESEFNKDFSYSSPNESEHDVGEKAANMASPSDFTHVTTKEITRANEIDSAVENSDSVFDANTAYLKADGNEEDEGATFNDANRIYIESNDHDNIHRLVRAHERILDSGDHKSNLEEKIGTNGTDVLCTEETINDGSDQFDHGIDKDETLDEYALPYEKHQVISIGSTTVTHHDEENELDEDDAVSSNLNSVNSNELSSITSSDDGVDRLERETIYTDDHQRKSHEGGIGSRHTRHIGSEMDERKTGSAVSAQGYEGNLTATSPITARSHADGILQEADQYNEEDIPVACEQFADSADVRKRIDVSSSIRLSENDEIEDSEFITKQQQEFYENITVSRPYFHQKEENWDECETNGNEAEELLHFITSESEDAGTIGEMHRELSDTERSDYDESEEEVSSPETRTRKYASQDINEGTFRETDTDDGLTTIEQMESVDTKSSDEDDIRFLEQLDDIVEAEMIEGIDTIDADDERSSIGCSLPDLTRIHNEEDHFEGYHHDVVGGQLHASDGFEEFSLAVDKDLKVGEAEQAVEPWTKSEISRMEGNTSDLQNLTLQQLVEDNGGYEVDLSPYAYLDLPSNGLDAGEPNHDAVDVFETKGMDWSSVEDTFDQNMTGSEAPHARFNSIDEYNGSKSDEEVHRSVDLEEYSDNSFDLEESIEEEELDS
uniref:Uncharacterized protein AlNc14C1G98 n=1 Tax=Albugo laibachii Nc14 TaxID=890382 RepID=F0VYU7_9STRA|nr:conserved hypothetical protein [Albugo laibachii Nc14]|eukprot:CCA13962.1 conserved hypothetical protein [Albugo laibachii Nc14]